MNDGLRYIRITGFASLGDVLLQPGRLTVLIGPDGSGKSNVLRALRMIPLMRTGSLQRFVGEAGGASALLHYGPKRTQAVGVAFEFVQGERRNTYEARLGFAAGDKLMYLDESVGYQPGPDAELRTTSLGAGHWESELATARAGDATARTVSYWLSQLTFFHFHDTSMTSACGRTLAPKTIGSSAPTGATWQRTCVAWSRARMRLTARRGGGSTSSSAASFPPSRSSPRPRSTASPCGSTGSMTRTSASARISSRMEPSGSSR